MSIESVDPSFFEWNSESFFDSENLIVDFTTFEEFDAAFQNSRRALFAVTDKINKAEREAKKAKVAYDRAWKRTFLESTEKTDAMKRARADIKCEELENEWLKWSQVAEELNRMAFALRTEINSMNTVANNLRAQLKL